MRFHLHGNVLWPRRLYRVHGWEKCYESTERLHTHCAGPKCVHRGVRQPGQLSCANGCLGVPGCIMGVHRRHRDPWGGREWVSGCMSVSGCICMMLGCTRMYLYDAVSTRGQSKADAGCGEAGTPTFGATGCCLHPTPTRFTTHAATANNALNLRNFSMKKILR